MPSASLSHRHYLIVEASHLSFLIPLAVAIRYGVTWYCIPLALMLISSVLYHGSTERNFSKLDGTFAKLLIVTNVILCILGHFAEPYFAIVFILIPISFYFLHKDKAYVWTHSMWHTVSALICVFSLLTYVFGK